MQDFEGRSRVVISAIRPKLECPRFAIKRIIGDEVTIEADIFTDGHQTISAHLLFKLSTQAEWQAVIMQPIGNDTWEGRFKVDHLGLYSYTIHAWIDYFKSWQEDFMKKHQASLDVQVDLQIGIQLIKDILKENEHAEIEEFLTALLQTKDLEKQVQLVTNAKLALLMHDLYPNKQWMTQFSSTYSIRVDPPYAKFSTWYEIFPRSFHQKDKAYGSFQDGERYLPSIAKMGFDVLYLTPIHPIGYRQRKGKNNQVRAQEKDPGSPWAIGSSEGGHKSIHPLLGSIEDFENFIKQAKSLGILIAMDIALQCSLDHPYLLEHPEWFWWRPDGQIQYAENPPKKYEDIVPFYFETHDWKNLWEELKSIFIYWIEKGVRIFRVDNPHTKPFPFWEWLINSLKELYPDVIFLAEAFTRPKVMDEISKLGFSQSYTYFTWRHTKQELIDYFNEIALSKKTEYFRPNLWPNTPDILPEELQQGGRPAFITRLILAATLSPNYGIYSPAFELMENHAKPGSEEYLNSEKYEVKNWNMDSLNSLKNLIAHINKIRKQYVALQQLSNLRFLEIDNDQILYYCKQDPIHPLFILVNLDPFHAQSGTFKIPLPDKKELSSSYKIHQLLSDQPHQWAGETQTITLNLKMPVCIFSVHANTEHEPFI